MINVFLGICQLLCVFRVERRNVALAHLHVVNGGVRQTERLCFLVALLFVLNGVIPVPVNQQGQHANQRQHYQRKPVFTQELFDHNKAARARL
ncbi:hypothetical protein [Atlantibacter hermannii]|uniref:hypothetical protein n=1 Tax=Atlantibacter hermannii TaxID=565 RepID=UPI002FFA70D7